MFASTSSSFTFTLATCLGLGFRVSGLGSWSKACTLVRCHMRLVYYCSRHCRYLMPCVAAMPTKRPRHAASPHVPPSTRCHWPHSALHLERPCDLDTHTGAPHATRTDLFLETFRHLASLAAVESAQNPHHGHHSCACPQHTGAHHHEHAIMGIRPCLQRFVHEPRPESRPPPCARSAGAHTSSALDHRGEKGLAQTRQERTSTLPRRAICQA